MKLQLPEGVVEQINQDARDPGQNGRDDQELKRINGLLDVVTRTVYSTLNEFKDRSDLPGILATTDRLNQVIELRVKLYELTRKQS